MLALDEWGRWQLHAELLGFGVFVSHRFEDVHGREYGLRFHNGTLRWSWGEDPMEWNRADAWWQRGSIPFGDWLFGGHGSEVESVIEERVVLVPMPEGVYPVMARLEVRMHVGRFRTRRWRACNLEVLHTKGGIHQDGKGENGWDCGPDGTYGLYTHDCDSIEQGVGELVATCLRNRGRYGNGIAKETWPEGAIRYAPGVQVPK